MVNSEHPMVSIVMLAWNRKDEVLDSLRHLFESAYDNYEVIVVDNGSSDGTADAVKANFPKAKLIVLPENIGIAGYNCGFEHALGDYVIVVDDDSYLEKDAISKMVHKFKELPDDIGIINFQVINIKTNYSTTQGWPAEVITFWGCGAGIKKELIDRIGGYDENLFLYRNEIEMSIRGLLYGYKTYHCQEILAYHKIPPNRYANRRTFYYANMNDLYILYKYFPVLLAIDHSIFIFFKTLLQSFKFEGFPFFSIWIGAFRKILKSKRKVIRNKSILKFIYNNHNRNALPKRFSRIVFHF